ncbi:hypothetical protein [Nesterenkonia halotolerans]|uniref:Cytochrome c oxidase assembly protein n=1 Tax=Nesterenkonia halotolerans TaxID=225325 RepID=A0ABR9J878_9MICC|nr:hypothetical protein [Nesterenkonia halotolerans]MBE1515209.1 hypothetical protein [Nesterenkonia halotolerans]
MPVWQIFYDAPILILAAVIVACSSLPTLRRRLPHVPRLPGEARPDPIVRVGLGVLTVGALIYSVSYELRSYLADGMLLAEYHWWAYADLLLGACAALIFLTLLMLLFRRTSAAPVAPAHPRTWRSFLNAGQLWLLIVPTILLLALVAFAGSVSSPDEDGIYRILVLDVGEDADGVGGGMLISFFGWAYGLPVAGVALALVLLTLVVLHVNAVRPFLRPETVAAEEASRSALATLFVLFGAGAVLVTLARATRVVSTAGDVTLVRDGYQWETSVSAISPWLFWSALALQLLGYVLLLMVARIALRRPSALPDAQASPATRSHPGLNAHG